MLLLTPALPGGVERFVNERCAQIRARGLFPLLLKPRSGRRQPLRIVDRCDDAPNLRYDIPADLAALVGAGPLRVDAVEIQHFLHLDARVIEAVRALGVPYDVVVHDYAWICPRVTLIDGSGRYCGEPAVSVCQACVRKNGSHLGESISVPALRLAATLAAEARRVAAPSADTAERLRQYFPALDIQVRPHAPPSTPPRRRRRTPRSPRARHCASR